MLLLADRGLVSVDAWRALAATGADLLWRTKTNAVLPVAQQLPDGSYLSQIVAARDHRSASNPVTVRVVESALDADPGRPQAKGTTYRLLTSILDPEQAPAAELAALYHQRWEFETALDELKTHQHGPAGMVLRSKTPEMVAQEVWGMLLVHRAIRELMHTAATSADVDPDRLSFTRSLRAARRQSPARRRFPPPRLARAARATTAEILRHPLGRRRLRANPRAVTRKVSNYQVKRAAHRGWPQPTMPAAAAVRLLTPSRPHGTRRPALSHAPPATAGH